MPTAVVSAARRGAARRSPGMWRGRACAPGRTGHRSACNDEGPVPAVAQRHSVPRAARRAVRRAGGAPSLMTKRGSLGPSHVTSSQPTNVPLGVNPAPIASSWSRQRSSERGCRRASSGTDAWVSSDSNDAMLARSASTCQRSASAMRDDPSRTPPSPCRRLAARRPIRHSRPGACTPSMSAASAVCTIRASLVPPVKPSASASCTGWQGSVVSTPRPV